MNDIKNIHFIQFKNLSPHKELMHFSTTIQGGVSEGNYATFNFGISSGDKLERVMENRNRLCVRLGITLDKLFIPRQTHSNHIHIIDQEFLQLPADKQQELLQDTDALLTQEKGIAIAVTTADCVPVLIYDPVKQVLGAIHSGWRGTVKKIASETVSLMVRKYNSNPKDLLACIGPSICRECFEVGQEVVDAFIKAGFSIEKIGNKHPQPQKYHLDLWKANKILLEQAGILSQNIEISGMCTLTHPDLFFSARRQTIKSGRMLTGGILK